MAHDLLTEPLLSWRDAGYNRAQATLPEVLAKLGSGELADFPQVRPHQLDAWCMFLAQLAAIALHRSGKTEPPVHEDEWQQLLLDLTDGAHEAWSLHVDDLSMPAFFQPPVPEGSVRGWPRQSHPDDLDILITSKNHDVKSSLLESNPELWAYALVSLQTMQGYPGRGYYGVSRMKGGYGSRPRVGLSPDQTLSARFTRDVQVLLDSWQSLIERGFSDQGLSLVWTRPWDGATSLAMPELSPHFVEICWRVRCLEAGGALEAAYTTTQCRRCLPEIVSGDAGDVWTPIDTDGGALTVGAGGFRYQLMTRFLFESEFAPAPAQTLREGDGDPVLLIASAMVRGQGKTEGLHRRTLPLTGRVRTRLGRADGRAALGIRAAENVDAAKVMRSKVLFPALKALALGETIVDDDFDARVNDIFFDDLFGSIEQPEEEARLAWSGHLHAIAWTEIQRAIDRCCLPSARWYRMVSHAEGLFHGCVRKQFPDLASTLNTGTA